MIEKGTVVSGHSQDVQHDIIPIIQMVFDEDAWADVRVLANKCEQCPPYLKGDAGRGQQQEPRRHASPPLESWDPA
jgi:hypothetical protein